MSQIGKNGGTGLDTIYLTLFRTPPAPKRWRNVKSENIVWYFFPNFLGLTWWLTPGILSCSVPSSRVPLWHLRSLHPSCPPRFPSPSSPQSRSPSALWALRPGHGWLIETASMMIFMGFLTLWTSPKLGPLLPHQHLWFWNDFESDQGGKPNCSKLFRLGWHSINQGLKKEVSARAGLPIFWAWVISATTKWLVDREKPWKTIQIQMGKSPVWTQPHITTFHATSTFPHPEMDTCSSVSSQCSRFTWNVFGSRLLTLENWNFDGTQYHKLDWKGVSVESSNSLTNIDHHFFSAGSWPKIPHVLGRYSISWATPRWGPSTASTANSWSDGPNGRFVDPVISTIGWQELQVQSGTKWSTSPPHRGTETSTMDSFWRQTGAPSWRWFHYPMVPQELDCY